MSVEGSLEVFRLPEIFQAISHERKTGILVLQDEQDIVAVSFLDGSVVAVDALNQAVEEKLGEVLEREGLVSREGFAEVVAAAQQGKGRLLDLLVERGVVQRAELMAAMRTQTYDMVFDLLRWERGEFKFYSGDEVAYEEGFRPIPIEELLLRAIAEGEKDGSKVLPEQSQLYVRVEPPPCEIRERIGPPHPGDETEGTLWVSSDESKVWDLLVAPQTIDALVVTSRVAEPKVRFALYRFLSAGVAQVHGRQLGSRQALRENMPGNFEKPFEQALGLDLADDRNLAESDADLKRLLREADSDDDRDERGAAIEADTDKRIVGGLFDVFLCHNSQDKPAVRELARRLRAAGLKVWLDEDQLRPGFPWQRMLEEAINQTEAAAVFVGKSGIGPWQRQEVEAHLSRFVRSGWPVIPVLLPDCPKEPDLPVFLSGLTWVDFRIEIPDPFPRLVWGITGHRPPDDVLEVDDSMLDGLDASSGHE